MEKYVLYYELETHEGPLWVRVGGTSKPIIFSDPFTAWTAADEIYKNKFKITKVSNPNEAIIGVRINGELYWRLENGRNKPIKNGTDYR